MYTFGQYVEDQKREAFDRGFKRGFERGLKRTEARGFKQALLEYIQLAWGETEADRCARELETTELEDLPDIADLMADQAAGCLPRLQANGRSESRN